MCVFVCLPAFIIVYFNHSLFAFLYSRSQHDLEVSTKQAIFVGSSVSDTIKTCIAMGNERAALKVKSEFKVFKYPSNMRIAKLILYYIPSK